MKRYQCMAIGCPFETDSKGLYGSFENVSNDSSINSQAGGSYLYETNYFQPQNVFISKPKNDFIDKP